MVRFTISSRQDCAPTREPSKAGGSPSQRTFFFLRSKHPRISVRNCVLNDFFRLYRRAPLRFVNKLFARVAQVIHTTRAYPSSQTTAAFNAKLSLGNRCTSRSPRQNIILTIVETSVAYEFPCEHIYFCEPPQIAVQSTTLCYIHCRQYEGQFSLHYRRCWGSSQNKQTPETALSTVSYCQAARSTSTTTFAISHSRRQPACSRRTD